MFADLFSVPARRVLHDDIRGRFVYTPTLLTADESDTTFAQLRDAVAWRAERRRMYDRDLDVPRLTAHFPLRDDEEIAAAPPPIALAAQRVREATGVAFNSVGLNHYRDGNDSVAMHHDHLYELVAGEPIAIVSLGQARRMTIRAKTPPACSLAIDLAAGSLLEMSYATQLNFLHGIPKTKRAVGPRISLAFRVRPATPSGNARRGFYD
jgi:alkylated DNA repair dioxygenase AlkB